MNWCVHRLLTVCWFLKQPETTKLQLDIAVQEDDSIRELREATLELVKTQKQAIEAGVTNAREVAESKIINGQAKRIN